VLENAFRNKRALPQRVHDPTPPAAVSGGEKSNREGGAMKEMKKLRRKSLRKMIKRKSVSLTRGLVPEYECFNVCSNAWGSYHTATVAVQARPKRGDGF
jgi:hypothetical protein